MGRSPREGESEEMRGKSKSCRSRQSEQIFTQVEIFKFRNAMHPILPHTCQWLHRKAQRYFDTAQQYKSVSCNSPGTSWHSLAPACTLLSLPTRSPSHLLARGVEWGRVGSSGLPWRWHLFVPKAEGSYRQILIKSFS